MRRFITVFASAVALTAFSSAALAITHTWVGGIGADSMSLNTNWIGGVPVDNSANLTLIFPTSPTGNSPNQNIATPLRVQSLQYGAGQFYQVLGNMYQMKNLGAAPTIDVGNSANVQIFAPLDFNAATTFTVGDSASVGLTQLSGSDLTINATGTSTLSSVFLSNTTANSLTGNNAFNGNAIYYINSPANVAAFGGNISVSALPTQTNQFRLLNANQFAAGSNLAALANSQVILFGAQTINDLEVSNLGLVNNNGATLTVQGQLINNGGIGSIQNGAIDFNGQFKTINTTVGGPSDILQISSPISNGRINKIGPGTVSIFNSGNSFTGQNVVNGGILAGNPDSIGTNVLDNATVQLGFGTLNSNIISGPGNVIVGNITFAVAQSYAGGTIVQGQAIGDTNTLLGNFSSSVFGEMLINQNFNGTYNGNMSGNLKLTKQGTGILSIGGNSTNTNVITLANGGLNILSDTAIGTGNLVTVNTNGVTIQATGTRTLPNIPQFFVQTNFVGSGNLLFNDTSAKTQTVGVAHSSSGTTEIDGKYTLSSTGSITVNSGTFILGDPSVVGGFTGNGPIQLNGGTLTVRSLNFTTLTDVTLAGGTLNAPNGYAIPLGAALQGNGGVTGRVASANGSSVIANGNLNMGDGTHAAGVNLDGELYTNQNTVTMFDSNQAVLGSLTKLGTPTQNGTLASANGYVLNFGRNITGRGQIQSTNTLAKAAIINGDVNGDSNINYLEFTGYVKGVGTFNNVAFSGTFSPGLSPTLMTVGNVILTPSNVLDMEIGGLNRGSQYDAFDINTLLSLNGTMKVTLLNTFMPNIGDQFLLFQGPQAGNFSGFNLAPLVPGRMWDTSQLYTGGILKVVAVPEPTAFVLVGMAMLSLGGFRRRNVMRNAM